MSTHTYRPRLLLDIMFCSLWGKSIICSAMRHQPDSLYIYIFIFTGIVIPQETTFGILLLLCHWNVFKQFPLMKVHPKGQLCKFARDGTFAMVNYLLAFYKDICVSSNKDISHFTTEWIERVLLETVVLFIFYNNNL